ncbi:hypothetical protein [Sphingobacterium deserti]|uniref:Uncharacterized protein n=1 Tax=Sphingobacterium deserti TaxID=1229276 RepID=A0A0B8T542_9SPHI|nr:hypothetical protein [Sphingobacterium deserti]KGE15493.1 hypothetical protein DI53_0759 [Sphingobacterium deserti]
MTLFNKEFKVTLCVWGSIQVLYLVFLSESFLADVDDDVFKRTARLTSSISILINIALIPAYMAVLGIISFFSARLCSLQLEKRYLVDGLTQVGLVFIVYNILKIANVYYYHDVLRSIDPLLESSAELLSSTKWVHIQQLLDFCVTFGAGLIFVLEIEKELPLKLSQWITLFFSITLPLLLLSMMSFS